VVRSIDSCDMDGFCLTGSSRQWVLAMNSVAPVTSHHAFLSHGCHAVPGANHDFCHTDAMPSKVLTMRSVDVADTKPCR
jgi:hypothetical protein